MDKATLCFAECLISAWLTGWPDYSKNDQDDYFSIIQLSQKISSDAKVNLEEEEGFKRVSQALQTIASYCRYNSPWGCRNLHFINRAYQTLRNEMIFKKRMISMRSGYTYNK